MTGRTNARLILDELESLEQSMASGRVAWENMEQAQRARVQLVHELHALRPIETLSQAIDRLDAGLPKGTQNSPFSDVPLDEDAFAEVKREFGPEAEENMRLAVAENKVREAEEAKENPDG